MAKAQAGTFALNRSEPIHRWYPYTEAYSSCFIEDILDSLKGESIHSVYDPFGGSGTTPLVAAERNIKPYYSETNPFMQGVIYTKINVVRQIAGKPKKLTFLKKFLKVMEDCGFQPSLKPITWDGFEKYFDAGQLEQVLFLKEEISRIPDADCRAICMLALSSILVDASRMVRRGDMRYAKGQEKKDQDRNVIGVYRKKLSTMISDLETSAGNIRLDAEQITEDARDLEAEDLFDGVITSPPYLNGTNYIRNTKLELKLNGLIRSEADLPLLHGKGIIAGINNVSKRNGEIAVIPEVQPYLDLLRPVAYDRRIPTMVAGYFSDMQRVIERLSHAVKDRGFLILDIGDSQFAGIHIPTHDILSAICDSHGFKKTGEEILRERRSKNGMVLSQRLLRFRLNKQQTSADRFKGQAKNFVGSMPYKCEPFSGRNWGHSWHSLCSYHGKMKPAIAHMLVSYFTEKGDVVLDPLCGVGTIPFEACLQGRMGIGNDLSEMAYVVTRAKLERPAYEEVLNALQELNDYIAGNRDGERIKELKHRYQTFGFNGKVAEYFEDDTYSEILCAREHYKGPVNGLSSADCMVFACLLHVLHGNRPYALSRNSHPLTPYAPKGDFIYKNVVEHIRAKLDRVYGEKEFEDFISGQAAWGDFKNISGLKGKVDAVICSPPFAGSLRFYMNNWLRLWLCGWEAQDYKTADERFLDSMQMHDFSVYSAFFSMCSLVLKTGGRVVLHLGKTARYDMAALIAPYATPWFDVVYMGKEQVNEIEKHGITDKGVTTEHQFLFLIKR